MRGTLIARLKAIGVGLAVVAFFLVLGLLAGAQFQSHDVRHGVEMIIGALGVMSGVIIFEKARGY